MIFKQRSC